MAERDLIVYGDEWSALREQAAVIAKSGLAPNSFSTPEQVIAAALVARDLGLSPAVVLQGGLYVVNGVVSCNSRLMMGMILKSGQIQVKIEKDPAGDWVRVTMKRPAAGLEYTAYWDEKRVLASRAHIDPKKGEEKWPWKLHRQTMKLWRAIAEAARVVAADIIQGLYLADEVAVPVTVEGEELVIDHNQIINGKLHEPMPDPEPKAQEQPAPAQPAPAPPAPPPPRKVTVHKTKANGRPVPPDRVKEVIDDKIMNAGTGVREAEATAKQRGLVASKLEECFAPAEDATLKRKTTMLWLLGKDSTKALSMAEASALLDWLLDQDADPNITGDKYPLHPKAPVEAAAILAQALKDRGQQEMEL